MDDLHKKAQLASAALWVTLRELRTRGRGSEDLAARRMVVAWWLKKHCGGKIREIGVILNRCNGSISHAVNTVDGIVNPDARPYYKQGKDIKSPRILMLCHMVIKAGEKK